MWHIGYPHGGLRVLEFMGKAGLLKVPGMELVSERTKKGRDKPRPKAVKLEIKKPQRLDLRPSQPEPESPTPHKINSKP